MSNQLEFTPRQRSAITAGITLAAVLLIGATGYLAVRGLAGFLQAFHNVIMPPLVAMIFAIFSRPWFDRLVKFSRGIKPIALILYFLSAVVPLGLIIWVGGAFAVGQIAQLFQDLSDIVISLKDSSVEQYGRLSSFLADLGFDISLGSILDDPAQMLADTGRSISRQLGSYAGSIGSSVGSILTWLVFPVYLAFFLLATPFQSNQLAHLMPFLKKSTRKDVIYLLDQFIAIIITFFRGQILISFLQGVLFGLGFALVGLPYGFLVGFFLGMLNIIPYLGSLIGMAVALPLAFFSDGGGLLRTALVLGVFGIVQSVEGYFLTPRIMGDRTGLHPAMIIFSVFFWGSALDGIVGMMLAIPLTAFIVVFWRLLKKKYIKQVL